MKGLVRVADVKGRTIGLGVDSHGSDAEFPAGPHHAHRNLAAVGDQDLLELSGTGHEGWILVVEAIRERGACFRISIAVTSSASPDGGAVPISRPVDER